MEIGFSVAIVSTEQRTVDDAYHVATSHPYGDISYAQQLIAGSNKLINACALFHLTLDMTIEDIGAQ